MAIIKKFSSYQNLSNYNVLVNDTNPNSDYFRMFRNLNFSTKKSLLNGLEAIRQSIMNSTKIMWFVRESEDGAYLVPIIGEGILRINKSSLSMVDIEEVDKSFVWEEFVWPFAKSILIHCYSSK